MKTLSSLGLAVLATVLLLSSPAMADSTFGAFAVSPDHPSTWVNGADNIHQDLRWDEDKHLLVADVKYSTVLYADSVHPTEENDYTLSFPSVKFDPATRTFTAKGQKIATLRDGFFGSDVVLDSKVELDIHRHHGRIYAAIMPSEEQ